MPRNLPTAVATAIGQPVTRPGYLIQLDSATPIRFSTRGTVLYDGQWWLDGAAVSGLSQSAASTPTVTIPNQDNSGSALLLGDRLIDVRARIWAYDAGAPDDAILSFDGVIDGAGDIGPLTCSIQLAQTSRARGRYPNLVVAPPLCNFITPAGTAFYILNAPVLVLDPEHPSQTIWLGW